MSHVPILISFYPSERARPVLAVNMVSSYICDNGKLIPYHCSVLGDGPIELCDNSDTTECDYAASSKLQ